MLTRGGEVVARTDICAYVRVSTKDKEQLSSFENQMSYFQREFGENENYNLVQLYADCGRSGTSLKRPAFDKMVADAGVDKSHMDGDLFRIVGKPKFSRILIKNTSRFARNVSADMLLKTLRKNGVYVDFMDTNLSTERDTDITMMQILQVLDENESRDKSRKVLFGIQEGIKRGNIHTHGNLYGYKYYPKPENRLEVREDEAEVVRLIFDLYANKNMGVQRIGEYLTEHGIFTRQGKPFSGRSLLIILRNITYTGRGVRNRFTTGLVFEKHPVRETGNAVIFETDKVPAIIDMETFEKAQSVLESKVQHQERKGIYTGKTDFAGKLVCGCCGAHYFSSGSDYVKSAGGRVRTYACKTKRTMKRDKDGNRVMLCNNPNVSETKINRMLQSRAFGNSLFIRFHTGIEELDGIRAALESQIDKQTADEVSYMKEQLAEIITQKDKLLDLYLSNMFSKEQLDEKAEPLKAEEERLQYAIKQLSRSNEEIQADIAAVDETIAYLQEQREIWRKEFKTISREEKIAGLESITVNPDGTLTFKQKGIEEVDRLVEKHQYLKYQSRRKVS